MTGEPNGIVLILLTGGRHDSACVAHTPVVFGTLEHQSDFLEAVEPAVRSEFTKHVDLLNHVTAVDFDDVRDMPCREPFVAIQLVEDSDRRVLLRPS
jgi:hypothetical protein